MNRAVREREDLLLCFHNMHLNKSAAGGEQLCPGSGDSGWRGWGGGSSLHGHGEAEELIDLGCGVGRGRARGTLETHK